jgi:hypothetical protein
MPSQTDMSDPLLVSMKEASRQLALPIHMVEHLVEQGKLITVEIEGRTLVAYPSLLELARRANKRK